MYLISKSEFIDKVPVLKSTLQPCKCALKVDVWVMFEFLKLENFADINSFGNHCKLLRCIFTDDVLAYPPLFDRGWAIL